ncbi:MAG: hypothetical protein OJF51_001183 [Nitrospira sp.]|jgi:hypothetical protein|nr:MAG: hypothetical protein OJF51_001183 [Nitrospira sp.]
MLRDLFEPGKFNLQALAAYSSCSVRWLRTRLGNRLRPLPHYRIEGKIPVNREEFDRWLPSSHVVNSGDCLTTIKLNSRALPCY